MRLAVFDLDGTLISINSFHLWLRYLLCWAVRRVRILIITQLFWYSALRLLGVINHIVLKKAILRLSHQVPIPERIIFGQKLMQYVRPELLAKMQQHKKDGFTVVIATAALDLYLVGFKQLCEVDAILATSSELSSSWQENLKAQKLHNIRSCYGSDALIVYAYSDHSDDLPLLKAAKYAIVVAPSNAQWQLLTAELVNCQRIL